MQLGMFKRDPNLKSGIPEHLIFQKRRITPDKLIIHHSLGHDWRNSSKKDVLEYLDDLAYKQWRKWGCLDRSYHEAYDHTEKNPKYSYINYHFVVWPTDKKWEIAQTVKYPNSEILWHAGGEPQNSESIGVVIMGDYREKRVDPEALKAIARFLGLYFFITRFNGTDLKIYGHTYFAGENYHCPGRIIEQLPDLKKMLGC